MGLCLVLGANNGAATTAISTGAGIMRYREAVIVSGLGLVTGLLLEGQRLESAVRNGVLASLNQSMIADLIISSLALLAISTALRLPISLSQCLVGSAIGVGIGYNATIGWKFTALVLASWFLTPFIAALLCSLIFRQVETVFRLFKTLLFRVEAAKILAIMATFYTSYVLGANTLGLVQGVLSDQVGWSLLIALLSVVTVLGFLFLGGGVSETVGQDIFTIGMIGATTAQLSGALTVHIFTQLGLPISISQASIGAILGLGLAKRMVIANRKIISEILVGWTLTPMAGLLAGFLLTRAI